MVRGATALALAAAALALAVAALDGGAGCAGPSRIEPGVCGNAVLEPGEDCDTWGDPQLGEGTSCSACRYVCTTAEEACPAGWGCSPDEICRHASGSWAAAALLGDEAQTLAVSDMNGDGLVDIAGVESHGSWIRFGGPDFDFSDRIGLPLISPLAGPVFHDLDSNGLLDVLVPVQRAFFVLAGSERGFDVIAQATFENAQFPKGLALRALRTDPTQVFDDVLAVFATDTISGLAVVSATDLQISAVYLYPTWHANADLRGMAVGDLDPGPESGADVVYAFDGEPTVQVVHGGRRAGETYLEAGVTVPIPEPIPDGTGLALADLDGDGALDLLVPAGDGVGVAHGDGLGAFSAVVVDARFAGRGWPLAIGDLDADGDLDYVFPNAVYIDRGGGVLEPHGDGLLTDITHAGIGDFNGDGVNDVAIARGDLARVLLLLGSDIGYFSIVASYDFEEPATVLRVADFDGDRLDDVAVVAPSPDGDALEVVFGRAELYFGAPVEMGRFERIVGMEEVRLALDETRFDAITDLLIMSSENGTVGEPLGIYVVAGTAARLMASGFFLGEEGYALFAGAFSPGGDALTDLVAVTSPVTGNMTPELNGSTVQLIHGRGNARFHDSDRRLLHAAAMETGAFDPTPGQSLWTSGDVNGDGRAEVIGLSTSPSALLWVASFSGTDETPVVDETLVPLGTETSPTSLTLGDVDGDAAPDLIVTWHEGLAVYWNDAGGFDAARVTVAAAPASGPWGGAVIVQGDADPGPEIAAVSPAGTVILEVAGRGLAERPGSVAAGGERIWAADVNQDNLDDLLVGHDKQVEIFRAVPHDE